MIEKRMSWIDKYSKITPTHIYFWGGSLANYFDCPFEWNNRKFLSSEQAYAYAKAVLFDKSYIQTILDCPFAQVAENLGRQVPNFDEAIWSEKRYNVMLDILKAKFYSDDFLKDELLSTEGKVLVFANENDTVWGVGLGSYSNNILEEENWKGQNLLGKALMEIREEMTLKH